MHRHPRHGFKYFTSTFMVVLGVVLVWRGVWYALDWLDRIYFGGTHWVSVIGGVVLGFVILYFPDRNLSELRKL